MRPTAQNAQKRPQERAGRYSTNHPRERSRRNASRPCLISVRPGHNPPRHPPHPPHGSSWQNSPHAHRAKSRQLFASRFFGRFWTGNAPQGDAAPGPAVMGEARPQDEPFPAPLAAMGADREPTGSADGGRASPAHRGGKIVGPARPIEADGRGRRGERPLQHDISRA